MEAYKLYYFQNIFETKWESFFYQNLLLDSSLS